MPFQILARVLSHTEVAPAHYRLRLVAPQIATATQAGQFVHILPRIYNSHDPLLRRAFSILRADRVDEEWIELLYRIEGRGTKALSKLRVGDEVDMIGPLGQPFEPLSSNSILVGGGVGVPPMAMLASTITPDKNIHAILGARTKTELICLDDFAEYGVPVQITTDDGSAGHQGRVTDLLAKALKESLQPGAMRVYTCGPLAMLRAVAKLCLEYSVPAQLSLEENMPCGIGVCNGCVIPIAHPASDYDRFRRICIQGPVVWAHEVDWRHYDSNCI